LNVAEEVGLIEAAGAEFRLYGEKVRIWYPNEERREELASQVNILRDHRAEVAAFLKTRGIIPAMPPGVRLVHWEPKPAPVILTHYAVVTDVSRFISMTLMELRAALAGKRWQSGHRSVRELVDRLEQCGVILQVSGVEARQPEEIKARYGVQPCN